MRTSQQHYTCHVCRSDRSRLTGIFIRKMDLESLAGAGQSIRLSARPNSHVVLKFECEHGHQFAIDFEARKDQTQWTCTRSASCEKGEW